MVREAGRRVGARLGRAGASIVRRLDVLQNRHRFLGLPWAVFRKYSDDNGAQLAALLTYYGFLSLFPLLLVATVIVVEVLRSQPELQQQLLERLVNPQIRPDVEQALRQLPSSGFPLALGLVSLVYAGTGGVLALYSALNRMWGVPRRDLYPLGRRYVRVLVVLVLAFASALLSAGSAVVTDEVLGLPAVQRVAAAAATAAEMVVLIAIAHKMLVCRPLRIRDFWVGAVIGAVVITALLTVAVTVLPALVARAGPVYGSFATVVGVFAVLYLLSQTLVLSVEISTVLEAGLSPRGLTDARLTASDRRALVLQARRQERVAGQRITTTFPTPAADRSSGAGEPGEPNRGDVAE
ncbi:YihY/virulence factor BrkB family protein [Cryptosporangium minutisporangium]|uniref:Uncharacterized protein n=1 Tax=Cryptosporangium minutisporangium TaxID=113569 RepID=A0ABP6SXG3_9ACTN